MAQELRVKGCVGLQRTELQQEVVPWIFIDFNPWDGHGVQFFFELPVLDNNWAKLSKFLMIRIIGHNCPLDQLVYVVSNYLIG